MSDNFKYAQLQPFTLAGAGAVIGDTSIIFSSMKTIDGVNLAMTDFGTKAFITLEAGSGTQEEQIIFTNLVQNSNGTATISGVKSVLFLSPYTQTTGLAKTHAGGTSAIVSNTSGFYDELTSKDDDETVNGDWTFTGQVTFNNFPITPSNSDASTTVKGVTKLSVAPVLSTNPIAVGDNDSRIGIAYAVDSSGSDAYAITPSPAITSYVAGQIFTFKAGTANTGAATLNVSGLGAKTIKKDSTLDLVTGDIVVGQLIMVEYDGTNMQLLSKTPALLPIVRTYLKAASPATWTKPAGLNYVLVEVQAGGGGGRGVSTAGSAAISSGAGGGGFSRRIVQASSLGSTETITIGGGGVGTYNSETDGGNSSFGTWATANGGKKGAAIGGAGGTSASGDLNTSGQPGTSLIAITSSGIGGGSSLGGGGASVIGESAGNPGTQGGGGSGASTNGGGGASNAGGAGGDGIVIVTEYYQ